MAAALAAAVLVTLLPPVGARPPEPSAPEPRSWAEPMPTRDGRRSERPGHVPGELLVAFDPGAGTQERARVRNRHDLERIESLPLDGVELVRMRGGGPSHERAAAVAGERSVRYAEPNLLYHPATVPPPDDPEYGWQWALHNTGQTGGTPGADISWPQAQTVTSGSEEIVVAVIDTGVDVSHEDLAPHAWVNPGETPDGSDSDGNGYVDDLHGWNFCDEDNVVFDDRDRDEHGTHVAGTISAVTNNAVGIAGVTEARIMALKFLCPNGALSNAVKAIDYAIANGARVINASWGSGGASTALQEAIERANEAGILFVAAAGNDGVNNDSTAYFPSNYPNANVVAVAATDHNDGLASFSNYGETTVDLGAPGASILSTVPRFAKAVAVGPDTDPSVPYRLIYHSFGLEGVSSAQRRLDLLSSALNWTTTSSTAPILLVDDDGGESFQTAYQTALSDLGFTNVTTMSVPTGGQCVNRNGPSASTMAGYEVVIWSTGQTYGCNRSQPTLTSTDQSSLTTYLNGGGNLLLFGLEVGFDLTENSATTNTFYRDVLRAELVDDRDDNYRIAGMPGTPYEGLSSIWLQSGSSGAGQFFSDLIRPRPGAVAAIRVMGTYWYSGTSMAAPHVAAAAAQLHASYPEATHLEVKARLMSQGDALAALAGKTVSGKRLNLAGALDTSGAPQITALSVDPDPFAPRTDPTAIVTWTQSEPAVVTVLVRNPEGAVTRTEILGPRAAGTHTWAWDATDDSAAAVPSGVYEIEVRVEDVGGAMGAEHLELAVRWASVVADFTGDGTTDISIFRPSNGRWYIRGIPGSVRWGVQEGDIPVPGDYTGNGQTDIAIYRPSEGRWYIRDVGGAQWGIEPGDIPVPGDYNGDGTTDIAIYRPTNGTWYIRGLGNTTWGIQEGDIPLPLPQAIYRAFFTR